MAAFRPLSRFAPLAPHRGLRRGVIPGLVVVLWGISAAFAGEAPRFVFNDEQGGRFPIGYYTLPPRDEALKELAASGINLVRCRDKADLDRCKEAGLFGWVSLPVDAGPTDALKKRVLELRDHPALAVWEGPDEIVWNFTAYSGLAETANITRDDWTFQRPNAVAFARKEAARILPRMNEAIQFVRDNDPKHRPFWINEAADSDAFYVRQYMDRIDATGCDLYPVKSWPTDLSTIGKITDRWRLVGRDKPVWMVLQAFSWHKGRPWKYPDPAYPTFEQTRFMAWDAIVHGARGIFYWGSEFVDDSRFPQSIFAMTAELSALEPFLVGLAYEGPGTFESGIARPTVRLLDADLEGKTRNGVRMTIRQHKDDWLIALVNEDNIPHHGVEVRGLEALDLEGRGFVLLHGDEPVKIDNGELMTRLQPYQAKVFATSRKWESPRRAGRDYR